MFIAAARNNKEQVLKMEWDFAGTRQRGVYLYAPIIAEMIDSSSPVDSPEFASALAAWQYKQGLASTGKLDKESWGRMVELLQTARLKSRDYPPMDQLTTAPVSDFYDPTRPDDLRKVHKKAYKAYKRMIKKARADKKIAAAIADPSNPESKNYFKIISAWRSREYQDELRKRQGGNLGRIALAKLSPHFTGRAIDIYVGGLPVSTEDSNRAKQVATPAYKWLVKNASKFGFRPYFFEPWHWEYVEEN